VGVHWGPLFDDAPERVDDEDETTSQILAQIHSDAADFVEWGRASLTAESGTKANPTYIHDSQDSKPSLANLRPETGRQPIPGLVSRPNPPRQQNGFKTVTNIGKVSYATSAAKAPTNPQPTTSASTSAPIVQPLTRAQLNHRATSRNMIATSAAALGLFLPSQTNKAAMVQGYLAALANRNVPGAHPAGPIPTPPTPPKSQTPRTARTSTWVIRRKNGCNDLPFTKPFNGDATTLARYLQDAIVKNSPGPSPPITLLGGRWGNNPNNFVLIFAGQPSIESIRKYRLVLLYPFDKTFDLIPNAGYTRLMAHGVPCIRKPDGTLPDSDDLIHQLASNTTLKGAVFIDEPMWTKSATADPKRESGAVSFALLDTNNLADRIIRANIWMYAKRVAIKRALPSYPFRQCSHCHNLTHPTERCSRPPTFTRCGLCGILGHTQTQHGTKCLNRAQHKTPLCDCPPKCFNCVRAKLNPLGHWAIDDTCPLKKYTSRTTPGLSQTTASTKPMPPTL
jgi:hypothetical protein